MPSSCTSTPPSSASRASYRATGAGQIIGVDLRGVHVVGEHVDVVGEVLVDEASIPLRMIDGRDRRTRRAGPEWASAKLIRPGVERLDQEADR